MARKLDDKELVTFKEMMMANSIQVDAQAQLLVRKDSTARVNFMANCEKL